MTRNAILARALVATLAAGALSSPVAVADSIDLRSPDTRDAAAKAAPAQDRGGDATALAQERYYSTYGTSATPRRAAAAAAVRGHGGDGGDGLPVLTVVLAIAGAGAAVATGAGVTHRTRRARAAA